MDINIYKEKLDKLPLWVRDYLESMQAGEYNLEICEKYGLETIQEIRKYLDLVNKIFFKELLLVSLFSEIKNAFGFDDDRAREMAIDIAGIKFLAVKDWLDKDVDKYIEDLGGNPDYYQKYVVEHDQALDEENEYFAKRFPEEVEDDEDDLLSEENIKDTELKIKDVFADKIVDLLTWEDDYVIAQVNDILVSLLDRENDQVFKNELLNIFLENKRIITEKVFVLDGKDTLGTVGNWIKDFIAQRGSVKFDVVVLSDFVNNSKNGRILSEEEKKMVSEILITYRNLKFSPDILLENNFEVIPLENNGTESPLQTGLRSDAVTAVPKVNEIVDFGKQIK